MPIDQIISHIANTNLEKQQIAQTPDSQTGAENTSAEASRRSSTSTQNTDTLTPTNIPSDPTDNQETIVSGTSAETVVEAHNIQNDANNSAFKSYQSSTIHGQMQMQQDTSTGHVMSEISKESQEQQDVVDVKESGTIKETNASDIVAEISTLTVPTAPARKVSRFLVSPVIEQKNIATEEESSAVNEGASHTSQSINQSIASAAESVLKNEEHVEANVSEIQSMNVHEQTSNNENTVIQGVPYTNVEQTDSVQQMSQPGQQLGLQQSIIQVQTVQQVTGHMQQTTTINQSKQHTIIVQGATITSQQTSQQIPQTSVQHFVPVNSQKELQPLQPLHTNGIAQTQTQYPNQTMIQSPAVVMQQQPQQQIPLQQNVLQPQAEHHGQMQQTQRASTVQQFVPQQVQPPTQQYVILSGHMQSMQPNLDDRNRRVSNISIASNMSMDSQISESSSIPEEKRQSIVTATNVPTTAHMQHVQVAPQDMSNAMPVQQQSASVEIGQQTIQTTHQNVQHSAVGASLPQSVPVPLPVHPVVTDISTSKVAIKTKEVSSTLPDLAQNLANILSNPKSKSATPHPLTSSHETTAVPNPAVVAAPTLVDCKPVQSEQYFQPIQPEVSQIQPPVQHNYQGQIMHQGYQGQQNFQQIFPNQQLLHQNQTQPTLHSIPLTIPQQIDLQSQMIQSNFVTGQSTAQGKWFISTNQINPSQQQQPILRHIQSNQPFQNQFQLQQIPMQSQMQQQTMQDQHNESSIVLDQSHLHLKLPEQPTKFLEVENLESSNLNWWAIYCYSFYRQK